MSTNKDGAENLGALHGPADECVFCDKKMTEAMEGSMKNYQPHGGGEVLFSFGYGSTKYDLFIGGTQFRGLICDDCAAKFVGKMNQFGFDFQGKQIDP